ncbi:MAG: carboxymuconolactone decarboxylase family protein [Prevotellaceae bacterium]|jgi:alkylhydroperoxidase/carboxymuconolactone decarboxylase family protein YurZ|nr:carboxymuconolactone decarboxylase family protein [Prevotellaceae bacterium]
MENKKNPLEIFKQEAPEIAAAFDSFIDALRNSKGLDAKIKQLIYIGMKAATGDMTAVYYHVIMAKAEGATRDEVKDTILLTLSVCGVKGVASCLPTALQAYDNA